MSWGLQLTQLLLLALIAISCHVLVGRARRPLIASLDGLAAGLMDPLAAISDVVAGLLYIAFAAATVPFDGTRSVGPLQVEAMMDSIALFAVLVAVVQLSSLAMLHRLAHHLEPWPPRSTELSTSS